MPWVPVPVLDSPAGEDFFLKSNAIVHLLVQPEAVSSYRLLLGKICATTLTNFYGYGASVSGQGFLEFFSGHFQFSLALWLLKCCLAVIRDDMGT